MLGIHQGDSVLTQIVLAFLAVMGLPSLTAIRRLADPRRGLAMSLGMMGFGVLIAVLPELMGSLLPVVSGLMVVTRMAADRGWFLRPE